MTTLRRATIDELAADPGLFDYILSRLVGAFGDENELPKAYDVCKDIGISYGGLLKWMSQDTSGARMKQFRNAMQIRAQTLAEDALRIADEAPPEHVQKARLRIDTRFRLARAYSPAVFGDTRDGGGNSMVFGILVIGSPDVAMKPDVHMKPEAVMRPVETDDV